MSKMRKRPKLSGAAAVLVYAGARNDSRVTYKFLGDDELPPAARPSVVIPLRDYTDMGSPDEITVTVWPGNTLGDK